MKFGAKNTLVGEVDTKFVEHFIDYLREAHDLHPNRKNPSKLSEGTIYLMYSIFRSITIELYKKKLIPQNPYSLLSSQFRLKRPESTRNYLSKSELAKVIQSECKYPQLKETFLFSCFTGLRKSDILSLTSGRDYSREWQSLYPKENSEDAAMAQDSIIPASDAMAAKAPLGGGIERNYFR